MRRREFIAALGGSAATWPLAARAQQRKPMRRIAVLLVPTEDDPQSKARITALQKGLELLGWTVGRNLQIDYRFGISDDDHAQAAARELLRLGRCTRLRRSSLA
jgi:putative tryptophan/tyrosine transport system substrate-binding protein